MLERDPCVFGIIRASPRPRRSSPRPRRSRPPTARPSRWRRRAAAVPRPICTCRSDSVSAACIDPVYSCAGTPRGSASASSPSGAFDGNRREDLGRGYTSAPRCSVRRVPRRSRASNMPAAVDFDVPAAARRDGRGAGLIVELLRSAPDLHRQRFCLPFAALIPGGRADQASSRHSGPSANRRCLRRLEMGGSRLATNDKAGAKTGGQPGRPGLCKGAACRKPQASASRLTASAFTAEWSRPRPRFQRLHKVARSILAACAPLLAGADVPALGQREKAARRSLRLSALTPGLVEEMAKLLATAPRPFDDPRGRGLVTITALPDRAPTPLALSAGVVRRLVKPPAVRPRGRPLTAAQRARAVTPPHQKR